MGAYTSMYPSIILKHVVILWPRVEKSAIAELRRASREDGRWTWDFHLHRKKPVSENAVVESWESGVIFRMRFGLMLSGRSVPIKMTKKTMRNHMLCVKLARRVRVSRLSCCCFSRNWSKRKAMTWFKNELCFGWDNMAGDRTMTFTEATIK